MRHETLFVLIGAPLLAELIGQRRVPQPGRAGSNGLATVCAVLAACVLLAGRLMLPATSNDSAVSPVSALAHVPEVLRRQPVLNSYDLGGYLIFSGVKTFIDGRTDMFGDEFNARYDAIMRPDKAALDKAVQDYGITWTFLSPTSPLAPLLEGSPDWRRLYADRYAVIDVRR